MIKNIINTVFVRIFSAAASLVVVVLNSKVTGAEGLGTASLIILAINIFILMTGFVSGALTYFVPRENVFKLFVIAYLWSFLIFVPFFIFLFFVPVVPENFISDVAFLALLQSGYNINEKILAGKEKIKTANVVLLVKVVLLPISLAFFYFVIKHRVIQSFVYSLFVSYSAGFVFSFLNILKYLKTPDFRKYHNLFKKILRLSGYNTAGAVMQKLNFRLGYYFIEYFWGIKILGIFSAGVQISESVLIIGRSISFVQYSKISNTSDIKKSAGMTISFVKTAFVLSAALMLFYSVIPSSFFSFLLGKDFSEIKPVIYGLTPAIIFASCGLILMHFFSGTGNHRLNMISSFAALLFTVFAGFFLIKYFKINGAAVSLSLSFFVFFLSELHFFKQKTNISYKDLFIKKEDFKNIRQLIKSEILRKKANL